MQQVISQLQGLQRRSRLMLVAQRVSVLTAWALAALLGLIVVDYLLRFPSAVRLVFLIAGLAAVGYAKWKYLLPAVLFRPSLTQLALRVERVLPAVTGRLASSVEFASAGIDQTSPLAARTVAETQTRLGGGSVTGVINSARTWRDVAILVVAVAATVGLGVGYPSAATTGLRRVFLPYSETKWPARTGVESLTTMQVHPRGQALALRAGVTQGATDQRIDAHYRLRVDGSYQPWQHIVLTHQAGGNIHERLVDTSGGAEELEVYFTSDDDQTSSQRIELVPPPAIRRASLTITPPEYAAGHVAMYQAELGQGVDSRAVTETPSLVGSMISLRFELNKAVPKPPSVDAVFQWSGSGAGAMEFAVDPADAKVWKLSWPLAGTGTLGVRLTDEYGLSNTEAISYRIEAVEDHPPAVTVTQPQADETVLPSAVVDLQTEARDDVALAKIGIEAHVQNGGRTADEAIGSAAAWEESREAGEPIATAKAQLALAGLHLKEGDIVLVSGVAKDGYPADHTVRSALRRLRVIGETDFATQLRRQLAGVRQNAIRIEAQQAELQDDVNENGMPPGSGLDRAQAQIGERIAAQRSSVQDVERLLRQNRLDDPQLGQILQQANDLLDAAGRAANKAVEAMEKKRPGEASTKRPNDEAGGKEAAKDGKPSGTDSAKGNESPKDSAGKETPDESSQAGGKPGEGKQPQSSEQTPDGKPETKQASPKSQEDRDVVDSQQEVRDELTDLIKLLDRDEDTWVVKKQLESLLKEQAKLEEETASLGEQTIGRKPEDLPEPQRTELDRIAAKQRDLRDEARKMIENMRQRAKAMEKIDSQSAESMRAAADTAEQRQLDKEMENAAQKAQQNQMTSATAAQQSAQSTMERMLNDIENTRRAQAAQLLRKLSSLVESIQRLITVQENELVALGVAKDVQNYSGLDRSMIRLNQNTQGVAGEARAAGQEARRIARTLDRAADTQGAAIAAFRAQPVQIVEAEAAENRSLDLLKEAKTMAEQVQKKTQEEEVRKRREELMAAYRSFAERQVAVRTETLPLADVPQLDRRQEMEARRLGTAQDEIRTGLNELRDSTSELLDSPVFVHVHRSIDGWSSAVSDLLSKGTVNVDVTDRQQQIADSIGRLIKSLEESTAPPDEFAKEQQNQQQQGGDSPGQQPLIPPITQLKLLREIQDQVYNLTKDLDGRSDLDSTQKRGRLREIGQQQRELMELGKQMLEALQKQLPVPPDAAQPEQPKPKQTPPNEPGGAEPQ